MEPRSFQVEALGRVSRSVKVQTLNMPWTIFKDAIRRRAYAVNGRIRGRSEPALEAATTEGRGGEEGMGEGGGKGGVEGCERTRV